MFVVFTLATSSASEARKNPLSRFVPLDQIYQKSNSCAS